MRDYLYTTSRPASDPLDRLVALARSHDQRLEGRQVSELARHLEGYREDLSRTPRKNQGNRFAISFDNVASELNSCFPTGVSNVSAAYLEDLLKLDNVIVPAVNQVERHPSVIFLEPVLFSETHGSPCLSGRVLKQRFSPRVRRPALSSRPTPRLARMNRPY